MTKLTTKVQSFKHWNQLHRKMQFCSIFFSFHFSSKAKNQGLMLLTIKTFIPKKPNFSKFSPKTPQHIHISRKTLIPRRKFIPEHISQNFKLSITFKTCTIKNIYHTQTPHTLKIYSNDVKLYPYSNHHPSPLKKKNNLLQHEKAMPDEATSSF